MHDLIRDSTVGQIINYFSRGHFLPYADQRRSYVIPARYLTASADTATLCEDLEKKKQTSGTTTPLEPASTLATTGGLHKQLTEQADDIPDPYLIDWEENDPDNPRSVPFSSLRTRLSVLTLGQKLDLQKTRFRRVFHLPSNLQYLYRECYLHVLHPWPNGRIPRLAHNGHAWAHAVHHWYVSCSSIPSHTC
jgi:hypothetical protein